MPRNRATDAEAKAAGALRRAAAEAVDESAAELIAELKKLTKATKKIWLSCPHCRRRSEVVVTDTVGATKAIEVLLRRGAGVAPDVPAPESAGLVVRRSVVPPSDESAA